MTDVAITPMGPGRFGVQLTEGGEVTSLVVEAEPDELADAGFEGVDPERLVHETLLALLDRVPAPRIADAQSLALAPLLRSDVALAEEAARRLTP